MNKYFFLTVLIISLQACSSSNTKEQVNESELPKYILSSFKESVDLMTWKVTIVDSVVTKDQLVAVATQIKNDSNFGHLIIHFYSLDMDKSNSSLVTIHYNPNERLPEKDRNGFSYEYEDRSAAFEGTETSIFKIK